MATKQKRKFPIDKFFDLAKSKGWILEPYWFHGRPGLALEAGEHGATMDKGFQTALDRHRDEAAAVLWEQAKGITREFRAKAAAKGATLRLVYHKDEPPFPLLSDPHDDLSDDFEKYHREIAAVLRAEAAL